MAPKEGIGGSSGVQLISVRLEVSPGQSAEEIDESARRAAAVLEGGGLILYPTETVYGLGGTGSPESNELIARIKRREGARPLILLTPDLSVLRQYLGGLEWTADAEALARRFWPGPLTLVIRCVDAPLGLTGPDGGVAVRVSPHPVVQAIFRDRRRPITSTSANPSGAEPAGTLGQALALFEGREDLKPVRATILAIDGGPAAGLMPSTVVSCMESPPHLLREGPIGMEVITCALTP